MSGRGRFHCSSLKCLLTAIPPQGRESVLPGHRPSCPGWSKRRPRNCGKTRQLPRAPPPSVVPVAPDPRLNGRRVLGPAGMSDNPCGICATCSILLSPAWVRSTPARTAIRPICSGPTDRGIPAACPRLDALRPAGRPDSGTVTGTNVRSSHPLARVCRPTQAVSRSRRARHHGASSAGKAALCRGERPLARPRDIVSRDTMAPVQLGSRHCVATGSAETAAGHRDKCRGTKSPAPSVSLPDPPWPNR
jgi:hypothetical protein